MSAANDEFWAKVNAQLDELADAQTAEDVVRVLSRERNPYGPDHLTDSAADGFFAGDGGDRTLWDTLTDAGWTTVWMKASYWYCVQRGGTYITYIEGDIYRGDRK